jgi:hypothetical protein
MRLPLIPLFAVVLGACVAQGPAEDPVSRSFTWFSYLSGEDIQRRCEAGGRDRWRFVYNAVWGEQVRSYDLVRDSGGDGATLRARVIGEANLARFDLRDPLEPWRGEEAQAYLPPAAVAELERSLAASDFDAPAPEGTYLRSDGFYWVASACRGGRFHFNAWMAPSPGFDSLAFPAVLYRHDRSGVPPAQARRLYLPPMGAKAGESQGRYSFFVVEVGRNGLKLGPRLR